MKLKGTKRKQSMQNEIVYTNGTIINIQYTFLNSNECTYIYTNGFLQNELFSI
jgi:hypothetical protein